MSLITLEIGPTWKMQLLRDMLEERGVPAFVADSNMKTIDPLLTGAMSFDARLQVPEEALESARAALRDSREEARELERARGEAEPQAEEPVASTPDLNALTDLGRRIRWAALLFWMHPFLFVYGVRYVRWFPRVPGRPENHGLTLFTLVAVTVFWGAMLFGVLRLGL